MQTKFWFKIWHIYFPNTVYVFLYVIWSERDFSLISYDLESSYKNIHTYFIIYFAAMNMQGTTEPMPRHVTNAD